MITYFFLQTKFPLQGLQCILHVLQCKLQSLKCKLQGLQLKMDCLKKEGRTDSERKTIINLAFLAKNDYLCSQKGEKHPKRLKTK